jgi:dihydrofolate reductase
LNILKISIIVARAKNNVIGKDNQLVWHLPGDLKHFKKTTTGHHIILGRKTFESMGKPLPNRTSIVITRNKAYSVPEGHYVVHNFTDALDLARSKGLEQVFVLGGAEIFKISLPWVDEMIVTEVDASPDGDTFFPFLDYSQWEKSSEERFPQNEKNEYSYSIVTYQRK